MRDKPAQPDRSPKRSRARRPARRQPRAAQAMLRLEPLGNHRFAFKAPPCARERDLDLEEVQAMIAAGETEIARDELLYLVADCRAFLEAHNLLGDLALQAADLAVARGHYGFAYELGLASLPSGFRGTLPAGRNYNVQFFRAGLGLARCLLARGKAEAAGQVARQLARFDPSEKNVQAMLRALRARQPPGAAASNAARSAAADGARQVNPASTGPK